MSQVYMVYMTVVYKQLDVGTISYTSFGCGRITVTEACMLTRICLLGLLEVLIFIL